MLNLGIFCQYYHPFGAKTMAKLISRGLWLLYALGVMALVGCSAGPSLTSTSPTVQASQGAQSTAQNSATYTPTVKNTTTNTATATAIPTPDYTVPFRIPQDGDHISTWGRPGTIQVWGTNVILNCNGFGTSVDFICNPVYNQEKDMWESDKTLYTWTPQNGYIFAGWSPLVGKEPMTATYDFKEPVTTFAVTVSRGDKVYVDSIAGITPEGYRIPIGFTRTEDGALVPAPLFCDTQFVNFNDYLVAEQNSQAPPVCGMVGTEIDTSYTLMGDGAVRSGSYLICRLPQEPANSFTVDNWYIRGVKAIQIVRLEITYVNGNSVSPQGSICR